MRKSHGPVSPAADPIRTIVIDSLFLHVVFSCVFTSDKPTIHRLLRLPITQVCQGLSGCGAVPGIHLWAGCKFDDLPTLSQLYYANVAVAQCGCMHVWLLLVELFELGHCSSAVAVYSRESNNHNDFHISLNLARSVAP